MNRVALVIAVIIGAIPLSALAQLPAPKESVDANRGWSGNRPFARLFITPDAQKPDTPRMDPKPVERVPGRVVVAPPRVVCGMTVVQADPGIDPNILVKPDVSNAGRRGLRPMLPRRTEYKIQKIAPPICH